MTVKELIEILKEFDENANVLIIDNNWTESIADVNKFDTGEIIISA